MLLFWSKKNIKIQAEHFLNRRNKFTLTFTFLQKIRSSKLVFALQIFIRKINNILLRERETLGLFEMKLNLFFIKCCLLCGSPFLLLILEAFLVWVFLETTFRIIWLTTQYIFQNSNHCLIRFPWKMCVTY